MKNIAFRAMKAAAPEYFDAVRRHYWAHGKLRLFALPRTFSECIQQKKLFDRNPLYSLTADKYAVRDYVAKRIGAEYLVPLLLVTDNPTSIDVNALPLPFVAKATHGSGMVALVRSRVELDRERLISTFSKWLETDYSAYGEWLYRDIPRRIVIETMLTENGSIPPDFKFFIFRGKVALLQYDIDRFSGHQQFLLDPNWRCLSAQYQKKPRGTGLPPRPAMLDEMKQVAARLGRDFPFCRIDLYCANGRIYFGEITHYPNAGLIPFDPPEFDRALGDLLRRGKPIPERFYAVREDEVQTPGER